MSPLQGRLVHLDKEHVGAGGGGYGQQVAAEEEDHHEVEAKEVQLEEA